MSNTDTDTDARFYPQPPPSPLTQVAQAAPQSPAPSKIPDRLPGGGISFHSGNLGISGGPPEAPIGNIPLPTPRPSQAPPPYATTEPNQRYTPHALRPKPETSELGRPSREVRALDHYPGLENTTLLPNRQEAYGVYRGGFKQMAETGPPAVAGPARIASDIAALIGPFLDFYSKNAFSSHYRATRLGETQEQAAQQRMQHERLQMEMERVKLQHARMQESAAEAISADSQIISEYADVFNQEQNGTITHEAAQEALTELNQKHNHASFAALLQNGGPKAVMQQLVNDHNRLMDTWGAYAVLDKASKTQRETEKERAKEEKQAEIEAPFRNAPGAVATAGAAPTNIGGYNVPPETAAAAGAAPIEQSADQTGPDLNTPSLDAAKAAGFNPNAINDLADKMLNGEFKASDYKGNDRVVGLARQRETEMRNQLRDVERDRNLKTRGDVLNAVEGVSPAMKDNVDAILTGGASVPRAGTAGSLKDPWRTAYALAQKAEPRISTILKTRDGTLRYFTSGAGAKQEVQLGTAYDHGDALLASLENPPPLWQQAAQFIGPRFIRDRLWPEASAWVGEVEKNIDVFSSETGAVLAYGQGTGAERKALREGMDWTAPNRTKAAIETQMARLRDRQSQLELDFKNGTGMDYSDFRSEGKDDASKNDTADAGLRTLHRDRAKDHSDPTVHDYREYDPGAR